MSEKQNVINGLLNDLIGQDVIITYGPPSWNEPITVEGILTEHNNEWMVAVKQKQMPDERYYALWIDTTYIISIESRNSEKLNKYAPKVGDKIVIKNLYRMKDPIGKEVPFYTTLEIISLESNYYAVEFRNELGMWTKGKILVEELGALFEWGCVEIKERGDFE